jgi:hypothetical protein
MNADSEVQIYKMKGTGKDNSTVATLTFQGWLLQHRTGGIHNRTLAAGKRKQDVAELIVKTQRIEELQKELLSATDQLAVYKSNDPLLQRVPVQPYIIRQDVVTNWIDATVPCCERVLKKQRSAFSQHQTLGGLASKGLQTNATCAKQQYLGCNNSWGTIAALESNMTGVRLPPLNFQIKTNLHVSRICSRRSWR